MCTRFRFVLPILAALSMIALPAAVSAAEKDKDAKPAAKAEKGKTILKEIFENEHVRVFEATFRPGDTAANVERPKRIVRAIQGGTLTRIYPDGKKDKITFKTGEARVIEASPQYVLKNEGKSNVVLFLVFLKTPKK